MGIFDALRPFLARWIAGLVAALLSWVTAKTGVVLDAETAEGLIAVMLGVFSVVYALLHKLIDKKLNPGDAASNPIIQNERAEEARVTTMKPFDGSRL